MIAEKWRAGATWEGQFLLAFCSKRYGSPATNDPALGDIRFGIMWGPARTTGCGSGETSCRYAEWVWFDDVIYLTGANQTWHHIAAVWDQGEIRLFFNGQYMNAKSTGAFNTFEHPAPYNTYDLQIGRFNNYQYWGFVGLIDEVRYTRGARFAHGASFIPAAYFEPDATTVGLWHFDEGTGTDTADSSGHNHPGVVQGLGQGIRWNDGGVPAGQPNP